MIKIAFASTDDVHVNTHFGAAERFVIFEVRPGHADLLEVGEFPKAPMKGANKDKALAVGEQVMPGEEFAPKPDEVLKPPEDKVIPKLAFIEKCAAVYAASIGNSSIKRLMSMGLQPIIVGHGQPIVDLLNEVSLALANPGALGWVDRALAQQRKTENRFEAMLAEGWTAAPAGKVSEASGEQTLITSVD